LYDCCHSAAITTTGCYQGNGGVKEVIAACGYETIAPEVDQHSFTNALIEILALASKGTPFSVGELHSRILSRLKCWTASLLYDEHGKILETPDGNLAHERQPRRTPIYSILCESKPRRSIVLAPLIPIQQASKIVPQAVPSSTSPNASPQPDTEAKTAPLKRSNKRKRAVQELSKEPKWPQIVLSVRLEEAELEISTWQEWIRSLPAEAKDIKIEGMYKSFSTLLLIRMPVSVWNLLPDNRTYSLVGYVTSENLTAFQNPDMQYNSGEIVLGEEHPMQSVHHPPKGLSSQQQASEPTLTGFGISKDLVSLAFEDNEVGKGTKESHPSLPSLQGTGKNIATPHSSVTQSRQGFSNTSGLLILPKPRGKNKMRVASACVPCKKAHARCDEQRPCTRCVVIGKGDACVDP
jgi:hypothetical protein